MQKESPTYKTGNAVFFLKKHKPTILVNHVKTFSYLSVYFTMILINLPSCKRKTTFKSFCYLT